MEAGRRHLSVCFSLRIGSKWIESYSTLNVSYQLLNCAGCDRNTVWQVNVPQGSDVSRANKCIPERGVILFPYFPAFFCLNKIQKTEQFGLKCISFQYVPRNISHFPRRSIGSSHTISISSVSNGSVTKHSSVSSYVLRMEKSLRGELLGGTNVRWVWITYKFVHGRYDMKMARRCMNYSSFHLCYMFHPQHQQL